nr:LysR substrate-binding domain-containing protein [Pseudomonas bharatica]
MPSTTRAWWPAPGRVPLPAGGRPELFPGPRRAPLCRRPWPARLPAVPRALHRQARALAAAGAGAQWPAEPARGAGCNNIDMLLNAALAGRGIACLPEFSVKAALDAGNCRRC